MRCAPLLDEAMTSGNSATAPRPASVRSPGTTRCTIREGRASSKWRRPRRERLVGRDRAVVRDDRGRGTLPGRKSRSGRRRKDTRTGCAAADGTVEWVRAGAGDGLGSSAIFIR